MLLRISPSSDSRLSHEGTVSVVPVPVAAAVSDNDNDDADDADGNDDDAPPRPINDDDGDVGNRAINPCANRELVVSIAARVSNSRTAACICFVAIVIILCFLLFELVV